MLRRCDMRKVTIIVLILVIAVFVVGFFYFNNRQESQTGYKDGLRMGFLYCFNDGKGGGPPETENLRERLVVEGDSAYDKGFLAGAEEGYVKGYGAGKEGQ
jgi:hypothetical protein